MGTRLNRLNEAIRTSTHNLCFRVEIRKFRIPLQTPVLLYNSGVRGGKNHIGVFSWWQRPRWASIRQQPHHKCCKLKTFPHSEHNTWFWDCSLKGRLAIHRYDQSNTMNHSSIITLNYLWLQIIFKQMCRWIVFKKCRWVVFNCVDELSPKTVSMSCLVDELSRFQIFYMHSSPGATTVLHFTKFRVLNRIHFALIPLSGSPVLQHFARVASFRPFLI